MYEFVIGHVEYCNAIVSNGMANDIYFFAVIVVVKAFMTQLLSPRQISLSGTMKYIKSYHKIDL